MESILKFFIEEHPGLLYVIFVFIIPTFAIFNLVIFFMKAKPTKKSILATIIALVWPTPLLFYALHFLNKNQYEDKGLGGLTDFFAGLFLIGTYIVLLAASTIVLRFAVLKKLKKG